MTQDSAGESNPGTTSASRARVSIPHADIADFCRQHHIRKLSLFGSVLRDDFTDESDIDVLVEFESGRTPGLIKLAGMERELSDVLSGRKVDMNTPLFLSPYFRDEVLEEAQIVYDQG